MMKDCTFDDILKSSYIACTGAGLKGQCYVGVLRALEDCCHAKLKYTWNQHVKECVKGISGASAGAIFALGMVLGLSSGNLSEVLHGISVHPRALVPNADIGTLWEHYGLADGNVLRSVIQRMFELSGMAPNICFEKMYTLTHIHFACSGTNLSTRLPVMFSHITHPNMTVLDAVYISACVPLLFAPIRVNDEIHVDGALTRNLPLVGNIGDTFVLTVANESHIHVASWAEYLRALAGLGVGAQVDHTASLVQQAKAHVHLKLSNHLNERPGMDMTYSMADFDDMRNHGFVSIAHLAFPEWKTIVKLCVELEVSLLSTIDSDEQCNGEVSSDVPCNRELYPLEGLPDP